MYSWLNLNFLIKKLYNIDVLGEELSTEINGKFLFSACAVFQIIKLPLTKSSNLFIG